jgi:hypothetical protein
MRKFLVVFIALVGLVSFGTASLAAAPLAVEQIKAFDAVFHVSKAGVLTVVERITYDFGDNEKHGIYRTIPLKYTLPVGYTNSPLTTNYKLRFKILSITDESGNN